MALILFKVVGWLDGWAGGGLKLRLSLAVIKILFQVGAWIDGLVGGGWEEK